MNLTKEQRIKYNFGKQCFDEGKTWEETCDISEKKYPCKWYKNKQGMYCCETDYVMHGYKAREVFKEFKKNKVISGCELKENTKGQKILYIVDFTKFGILELLQRYGKSKVFPQFRNEKYIVSCKTFDCCDSCGKLTPEEESIPLAFGIEFFVCKECLEHGFYTNWKHEKVFYKDCAYTVKEA